MSARKDVETVGSTFGSLFVTGVADNIGGRRAYKCVCECGETLEVRGYSLRTGNTSSCGCVRRDKTVARNVVHGMSKTPEYQAWLMTRQRCENPNQKDFKHYGGRGIYMCERWKVFENFLEDMGRRPKGLTLERLDNDGPYTPGNCVWASRKAQASNTRRNRVVVRGGDAKTLSQWAEDLGMPRRTVNARVTKLGYSEERALTQPIRGRIQNDQLNHTN